MTAAAPETAAPWETAAPAETPTPTEPRRGPPRTRPRPWRRSAGGQPDGPRGSWLWLTCLGHVVLWLLVAGGAGAGIASLALHASPSATPHAEPPAPTTPAEGFAELYVAAYLQAGQGAEEAIEVFYPATVTLADVTPGAMWVARTTAVAADEQSPAYWAVTVAADVLTAGGMDGSPRGCATTPSGSSRSAGAGRHRPAQPGRRAADRRRRP